MVLAKQRKIGTLYASHSTTRNSAKFKSIPFHDASIDWKRTEASTMSFKSPIKLEEADRIRYKSDRSEFGGQVYKVKKTIGEDYQYEAISYLRLYHDKVNCSYKNMSSSQIMKKVLGLSKNNFVTSGIRQTAPVHSYLKWEKTSIWDIAQQLCWLECRCSVNADGTFLFCYISEQQKGYTFTNVLDYEEEHDSTDLITQAKIIFEGKEVANATASSDIVAKWGYVTEVEDCQSMKTETTTTATTTSTAKANTSLRDDAQIQKYNIPSKIVTQALAIAKKGNSPYNNLHLIHNWINKNVGYKGYSNSRIGGNSSTANGKSALKCLNMRSGNCCDHANLTIAMARSIGIKSRYAHAKQGTQGHLYGEYYVNGKWFVCDNGTKSTTQYWGSHWNGYGGTDRRYEVLPF